MGRIGSGLVATAIVCALGTVAFAGCTADGTTGEIPASEPASNEPSASLPEGTAGEEEPEEPVGDAGKKKDAGKSDAGKDAGPPPPEPGDACSDLNKIVEKKCGACGKQSTVCLAGDDGTTGTWSQYSSCSGELAGGCIPGESVTEECGNCGTRVRVCSAYCVLSSPVCSGEPADSCPPGSVDLTSAGCTTPNTFRARTCKADCSYNPYGDCAAPPTTINVAPTVGSVSSTVAILSSSKTMPKLAGTCPNATLSTTISSPYTYIQVKNTLSKTVTASIYNSLAPGGVVIETTLASYVGAVAPTAEAARKACDKGTNTLGTASLTGDSKFASLDGTRKVTIPAGGTVSVYVAADKAYDASKPAESTGPVKLNVKTETLE